MKRRINIPFTPNTADADIPFETRAILWFGQVSHQDNYADVRMIYTPEHLHVHCNIIDEKIWYDNEKPIMLFANDAVSVMFHTEEGQTDRINAESYYFAGMFKPEHDERPEYQRAFGGETGHWRLRETQFKTFAHYRGAGAFNTGEASHGWWIAFKIPFASLGLDGPPKDGAMWKMAILLHDRDSDQSEIIPNKSWPESVHQIDPSTWGELHFGQPAYKAPDATPKETVVLKDRVARVRIKDATVGGAGTCGDDMSHDLFGEWGIRNYKGVTQFNVQNQGDIADWPCFSKYYITVPLNSLPDPSQRVVLDASLEIRQFGNAGQGWNEPVPESYIQVFSVEEPWNENTITWNSAPIASENYGGTWVKPLPEFNAPWPGIPHQLDVTRAVQEAYAARKPLQLVLYSADGPRHTGKYFYTSKADLEGRPQLTIRLGEPRGTADAAVRTDVPTRPQTQPLTQQAAWSMAGASPARHSRTAETVPGNLRPLWYKPIAPYISQRTQIVAAHNMLYLSTARGLYALDANDGTERWVFPTELPLGHSPTLDGDVVYVCGTDGCVYALDAQTGAALWQYQAPKGFVTNPVVADRLLFAGCRDGSMYAIHTGGPDKGKLAWKFRTKAPILYSAAYHDGVLYFASMDSHAYALIAVTGKQVWRSAKLPGQGFRSWWPVVIDDYVIFSGSHGYRTAVEPGGKAKMTDIDRNDVLDDFVTPERNVITLGERGHADGPWAPGTVTLTTEKVRDYLGEHPYRRTVFVLNRATGEEVFETDAAGRSRPVAPLLWAGTQSGTRYPPVVGADGVLYQQSGYMIDTDFQNRIMGGHAVGWHPDYPGNVAIPSYMWCAVDEPLGLAMGGNTLYWNLCCDRQAGSYDVSIPNALFEQALIDLEALYTKEAGISAEHKQNIAMARPGNLGTLHEAPHREALYVADELCRHADLNTDMYADCYYRNAWIVIIAVDASGNQFQFLTRPEPVTQENNQLVAYATHHYPGVFERGASVSFVHVPQADAPRTYIASTENEGPIKTVIPAHPRVLHTHTAFGQPAEAVYSNHGDQNPPIPYNGRVYMHRSNAIICWAPAEEAAASAQGKLPVAKPHNVQRNKPPYLVGILELKRQLSSEILEILNSGPLQPGYANHGLLGQHMQHHIGDALLDYFHNPAETFVSLLRARPYIAGALQNQLDEYLRAEFNTFEQAEFCNHIGWQNRRQRHDFLLPDDVINDYTTGENVYSRPRALNYEFRNSGGWQSKGVWGRNPYLIYGLQKMVSHFGLDAQHYLDQIRSRQLLERIPSKDVLIENPYAINAWLAGYAGLLKLYDAIPNEMAPVELLDQIDHLKVLRNRGFQMGSPYTATSEIFNGTSYYGNALNIAANFLYMTPEVVSDTYGNIKPAIQAAIQRVEKHAPHWFITFAAEGLGENAIVPLWDAHAIFMAKAWILGDSGPDLEKYLDVPGFPRGDLFHIDKLVATIEAY